MPQPAASTPVGRRWRRPMAPRDPRESSRAATPLELFFDLVFVVAIAQAASGLHHAVADAHALEGIGRYLAVFFAIWWAWVNFTWFASAYDTDDVPYRVMALVQMTGALILAAGVPTAFEALDFTVITVGYVVMRMALVTQWLRARLGDPARRTTATRYALGVTALQLGWVGLLFVPASVWLAGFLVLVLAELAVPMWAESATRTPWHPHHISERHGLLTIIVLGESVLAATLAMETALAGGTALTTLLPEIAGGLLLLYAMWWIYFDRPAHDLLDDLPRVFLWGYGHYLVYGAAAAVGAGIAVATDVATDHAAVGMPTAGLAVALPAALYLAVVWLLHHRPRADTVTPRWLFPSIAVLVLLTPLTPSPVLACGVLVAGLPVAKVVMRHRVAVRTE